ncbi:hypothetical protein GQ55_6G206600 [Panicum hallii var. hallii]|uniref:Uncharacterized protein n=1 Tax=Panicum hallii var. hallii TaxID=1504633 RepID=A0A2T7D7W0_9POAL|nr:hypothetical protein GQ55_6G206600 [Panicum hallii var. hallii]
MSGDGAPRPDLVGGGGWRGTGSWDARSGGGGKEKEAAAGEEREVAREEAERRRGAGN